MIVNINPENSSTTKVGEHIPSGFSISAIISAIIISIMYLEVKIVRKNIVNIEHAMMIVNFKKKKWSY